MATPVAAYVCTEEFKRLLKQLSIGTGAAVAGAAANAFKLPAISVVAKSARGRPLRFEHGSLR
jgi:hypothetical protein